MGLSWCGIKLSADMIYGSGLRNGDDNITTVPAYTQVNIGIKREFLLPNDPKPMTVRFDVVNLFDTIYEIRDGTGIGVFAPQYGPRRGFFLGLSKKRVGVPHRHGTVQMPEWRRGSLDLLPS
jgi:outer membrane receptor protein involved in Fe transport